MEAVPLLVVFFCCCFWGGSFICVGALPAKTSTGGKPGHATELCCSVSLSPGFYTAAASVTGSPAPLPGTVLRSILFSSFWENLWTATRMAVFHCIWWVYHLSGLLDMWGLRGWIYSYWLHSTVSGSFPCCDLQTTHSARWQVMDRDRSHNTLLLRSVSSPASEECGETIHQVSFMCNAWDFAGLQKPSLSSTKQEKKLSAADE